MKVFVCLMIVQSGEEREKAPPMKSSFHRKLSSLDERGRENSWEDLVLLYHKPAFGKLIKGPQRMSGRTDD